MTNELRRKVKTDRRVTLHGKSASAEGHLVDVSLRGIGVVSERGARIGTELDCVFELPAFSEFKTFDLQGVVTHRHNTGDEIYLHIAFDHLNDEDKSALQDFIDYKNRLSRASKRTFD